MRNGKRELEETVRRQKEALRRFLEEKAVQGGMTLEAYVDGFRDVDPGYAEDLRRRLGL